jgi:hypothetical protein
MSAKHPSAAKIVEQGTQPMVEYGSQDTFARDLQEIIRNVPDGAKDVGNAIKKRLATHQGLHFFMHTFGGIYMKL